MAIKIESTKLTSVDDLRIKVCVYSLAGIGKTVLCGTAPRPLIMSAERGLLSLANKDVDYTIVQNKEEIDEVYNYALTQECMDKYDTICLDSVSEIGEVMLATKKKQYSDPRQAYGETADEMGEVMRKFRDLPHYNVVFTATQERFTDDFLGVTTYRASMPGNVLTNQVPHMFDEVFVMRIGMKDDGSTYRYVQPNPCMSYYAKDRSGALGQGKNIERPDLGFLFSKIKTHLLQNPEKMKEIASAQEAEIATNAPEPDQAA
jgi:hypothetical protein